MVVECDDPNYPVIAVFSFGTSEERAQCERRAAALLAQIKAAKVDYRRLATRVPEWARWSRDYTSLFTRSGLVELEGV